MGAFRVKPMKLMDFVIGVMYIVTNDCPIFQPVGTGCEANSVEGNSFGVCLQSSARPVLSTSPGATPVDAPKAMTSAPKVVSPGQSSAGLSWQGKNPVSALYEYGQARGQHVCIEVIQQSGPPHNPRYGIPCKVVHHVH